MTTANLMNVPSVKGNVAPQADASKKLQDENLEIAEVFAGLMNQTMDIPNSVVDDTSSNMDVSKTDSAQSPAESYERYSYKDNKIDTARETSAQEKLEESGDVLEQAGEEVVDTLCDKYGVDEETIQNLLDEMGMSVLDLLNPQNLVSFIVELTGVASGEGLLLDENFLSVMETLNHLAENLMNDLNVDRSGLQELIAEMDILNTETEVPADFQETLEVQVQNLTENADEANADTSTDATEADVAEVVEEGVEVKVEKQEETSESKVQTTESEEITVSKNEREESVLSDTQNSEEHSLLNQDSNSNEAIITNQTTANVSQVADVPQSQFSSYLSVDTVQIMEQIVEQMRVNVSTDTTSMEMQLNPENLGKVYVNISSEEGIINAQFHATNEIVKEALETQIATLRENLNQAGVKVDSIEVTIASHEFERNLEQNHQNPEEHVESQNAGTQRRRNITIDSLDELSGIMTEEETLVAQIMKENGNSVDLTA